MCGGGAPSTARERDEMRRRLAGGDNLVLFPEGTTSDGSRVMSFRSAFLSVALLPATPDGKPPIVQPVSVAYDRLAFLPAGRSSRPLFAWYGDMDIATHFWRLTQHRGLRASVLLHAPVDPASYPSRKELGQAPWKTVAADGAGRTLRQNRPGASRRGAPPAIDQCRRVGASLCVRPVGGAIGRIRFLRADERQVRAHRASECGHGEADDRFSSEHRDPANQNLLLRVTVPLAQRVVKLSVLPTRPAGPYAVAPPGLR